uniref:Uncharacterized protein n=1 Tax=Strigamia maritima TaxID=126957 RepID=T1JCK2_STRMM
MHHLKMKLLLVGLILLFAFVQNGFSLDCYECISDKNCKDSTKTCTVENPACLKFDGTKDGKTAIIKRCVNSLLSKSVNKCGDKTFEGGTGIVCMCSTDLCNGASVIGQSKVVAVLLVFVAFLIHYFI